MGSPDQKLLLPKLWWQPNEDTASCIWIRGGEFYDKTIIISKMPPSRYYYKLVFPSFATCYAKEWEPCFLSVNFLLSYSKFFQHPFGIVSNPWHLISRLRLGVVRWLAFFMGIFKSFLQQEAIILAFNRLQSLVASDKLPFSSLAPPPFEKPFVHAS